MKKNCVETRRISTEDRDWIINNVQELGGNDITNIALRMALALKVRESVQEPDWNSIQDLNSETRGEYLLLEFLFRLGEIEKKNDGVLYFPNTMELSEKEKGDVKRQRIIEKVVEMRGDKKKMDQHRANLAAMFEAAPKTEAIKETFAVLDGTLEADIMYNDSLTNT